MRFINHCKNTILLGDINKSIPYIENETQTIDIDEVKKSKNFRLLVAYNEIEIVECGDTLFERNLLMLQEEAKKNVKSSGEKEQDTGENMPKSERIEVKIRGHFYEAGGYAKVNRNLVFGLTDLDVKVAIEATNKTNNELNENDIKKLSKINYCVGKNAIVIDSMIPTFSNLSGGRYRILYTTIEACSVPQQFLDTLQTYNEVWVTSDFCKEVLQKYNLKIPIYVMPDSVDTELYHENYEPIQFNPPLKDFVFISVFGWSYRKGYDVLLKSYLEEFTAKDDVSLLIVSRYLCNSNKSDIVRDTIKQYIGRYDKNNVPHIVRHSQVVPENQMPNLYCSANAFVCYTRGEGFFIPACEASLCGLPVISTNHSGHIMFLKKDNSTLIDVDQIVPMQRGLMHVHYWDDQLFPSLTSPKVINDAKKAMRNVYEDYFSAKEKNKKLQNFVKENYDVKTICEKIKNRLQIIWSKI